MALAVAVTMAELEAAVAAAGATPARKLEAEMVPAPTKRPTKRTIHVTRCRWPHPLHVLYLIRAIEESDETTFRKECGQLSPLTFGRVDTGRVVRARMQQDRRTLGQLGKVRLHAWRGVEWSE